MKDPFEMAATARALRSEDPKRVRGALDALEQQKSADRDAIQGLVALTVNGKFAGNRQHARSVLDVVDPNWRQHDAVMAEVLSLTFLLDDFDKELGARAETMLSDIGEPAISYVLDVALEMDEDRRAAANRVLEGMEKEWFQMKAVWAKAEEVLEKMESKFPEVAAAAAEMLVKIGEGAVPELLAWKVSPLRTRRNAAETILEQISPQWYSLVPVDEITETLIPNLESSHSGVVKEVKRILFGLDEMSTPYLADALEPHARTPVVSLLHIVQLAGRMGAGDDRIVESLLYRWEKSEKPELRAAVILALSRNGYRNSQVLLPRLIHELEHGVENVKLEAAAYLEILGPVANPAAAALARLLSHKESEIVAAARQALEAIDIAAGPALAATLNDDDREEILKILSEYQSTFTTNEIERVKRDPVQALNNMGWNMAFAQDAMERLTQRKLIAMQLIEQNGYQGQELVRFLQHLLDSKNEPLKEMATKLYKKMTFL